MIMFKPDFFPFFKYDKFKYGKYTWVLCKDINDKTNV